MYNRDIYITIITMKNIINTLESLNESFRKELTWKEFPDNFSKLNDTDKDRLLKALSVSVNNAMILTNKLTNNGWK